jgi:dihydroxy-acid dehydratase
MTENSFENAITLDMIIGAPMNTVFHLPAIVGEPEIELKLNLFDEISRKTRLSI